MINLKKLCVAALLSLAVGTAAFGVVQADGEEACCCDHTVRGNAP